MGRQVKFWRKASAFQFKTNLDYNRRLLQRLIDPGLIDGPRFKQLRVSDEDSFFPTTLLRITLRQGEAAALKTAALNKSSERNDA